MDLKSKLTRLVEGVDLNRLFVCTLLLSVGIGTRGTLGSVLDQGLALVGHSALRVRRRIRFRLALWEAAPHYFIQE